MNPLKKNTKTKLDLNKQFQKRLLDLLTKSIKPLPNRRFVWPP